MIQRRTAAFVSGLILFTTSTTSFGISLISISWKILPLPLAPAFLAESALFLLLLFVSVCTVTCELVRLRAMAFLCAALSASCGLFPAGEDSFPTPDSPAFVPSPSVPSEEVSSPPDGLEFSVPPDSVSCPLPPVPVPPSPSGSSSSSVSPLSSRRSSSSAATRIA